MYLLNALWSDDMTKSLWSMKAKLLIIQVMNNVCKKSMSFTYLLRLRYALRFHFVFFFTKITTSDLSYLPKFLNNNLFKNFHGHPGSQQIINICLWKKNSWILTLMIPLKQFVLIIAIYVSHSIKILLL